MHLPSGMPSAMGDGTTATKTAWLMRHAAHNTREGDACGQLPSCHAGRGGLGRAAGCRPLTWMTPDRMVWTPSSSTSTATMANRWRRQRCSSSALSTPASGTNSAMRAPWLHGSSSTSAATLHARGVMTRAATAADFAPPGFPAMTRHGQVGGSACVSSVDGMGDVLGY